MTSAPWLAFIVILVGCAATNGPPSSRLRTDGVYAGGDYPYGCVVTGNLREFYPESWDLLRFYPDGTVIEETATLFVKPSNSQRTTAKENPHATRRGIYTLEGNRVSFVTTEPKRVENQTTAIDPIRSSGRIDGNLLILRRHRPESESGSWWTDLFGKTQEYRFQRY